MDRRGRKHVLDTEVEGGVERKVKKIRLISPWKRYEGKPTTLMAQNGKMLVTQLVAMAIKLLNKFLEEFVERCGEVIEIRINVGEFGEYLTKDCYPKGLNRDSLHRECRYPKNT